MNYSLHENQAESIVRFCEWYISNQSERFLDRSENDKFNELLTEVRKHFFDDYTAWNNAFDAVERIIMRCLSNNHGPVKEN